MTLSQETIALINGLRGQNLLFEFILDNVPASIFWKSVDGHFLGANKHCLKDMGVESREAVVSKTDYDLFPKEQADNFRKDDAEVMAHGAKLGIEEPQEQKDGTHWLVTHKIPLLDHEAVIGILGVYVDITDRKKLEIQLKENQEQLVHNSKLAAVGTLIAGLSHELNNPLSALLIHLDFLLSKEKYKEDAGLRKALFTMIEQTHRCSELVASLLHFSRKGSLEKETLTIDSLFRHVGRLADPMSIQYEAVISFTPGSTNAKIFASRQEIETVLLNIITNSLQALDKSKPGNQVRLRALDFMRNGKEGVEITVSDTGCGIAEANLPHVFEPFFTTKNPGDGTGLGLSLARKVIEEHGGNIEISSTLGKGTRVHMWLPSVR